MAQCKGKNKNGIPCRRVVKGKYCYQHCDKKRSPKQRSPKRSVKSPKSPKHQLRKKTYEIHDNGGRPFRVDIHGNHVTITKEKDKNPVLTFDTDNIFIGKSPKNAMTEFSGSYGPEFDGNSILLQLHNGHYVYIGSEIYQFAAKAPIVKYVSPVGNSDVPYPYAIDKDYNYYLMIQDVILLHRQKLESPYDDYYEMYQKDGYYKGKKIVSEYIDQLFMIHYTPKADKDYDRLTENGKLKMYLVDEQKQKHLVNKNEYIQFMKEWGKRIKVEPLHKKVLVEKLY